MLDKLLQEEENEREKQEKAKQRKKHKKTKKKQKQSISGKDEEAVVPEIEEWSMVTSELMAPNSFKGGSSRIGSSAAGEEGSEPAQGARSVSVETTKEAEVEVEAVVEAQAEAGD